MEAKYIEIAGGDTATPLSMRSRIKKIGDSVEIEGSKILDCGCGRGSYVLALRELGADAVGIEFLEEKVKDAHQSGVPENLVRVGDAENMSFEDSTFDVLIFNEVLEHVPHDSLALKEAFRVLRPGGSVLVFSPNRLYPFETHGVYKKGTKNLLPVWTPLIPYLPTRAGRLFFDYWARNYWPNELRGLIKSAGFYISDYSYLWQTFEGISNEGSGTTNWMKPVRPLLRKISKTLERCPGIKSFGVSQFVHGRKEG